MNGYKLTDQQLNRAVAGRRFSQTAVNVAKQLMVDGISATEIAAAHGISRARVYQIRDQVWAAHMLSSSYPPTWKPVTLMLPPELVQEVLERAESARQAWLNARG